MKDFSLFVFEGSFHNYGSVKIRIKSFIHPLDVGNKIMIAEEKEKEGEKEDQSSLRNLLTRCWSHSLVVPFSLSLSLHPLSLLISLFI